MKAPIKVPAVGESITEATISSWTKKNGDFVKRDEQILVLETDKASVDVVAENEGVLSIKVQEGTVVAIGALIGEIDTDAKPAAGATSSASATSAPAPSNSPAPSAPAPMAAAGGAKSTGDIPLSPAVRRVVDEKGLNPAQIQGTGPDGRILKGDALRAMPATAVVSGGVAAPAASPAPSNVASLPTRVAGSQRRVPMTTIRKRIAERLVQAQHNAAILTTFNEIDMSGVMALREKYKDRFKERYNVSLGFMGFFVKACVEALKAIPQVNAFIDGTDMIFNDYYNVGVAVGTEKGLIVPVIKGAEQMSIAQIEMAIRDYAIKARDGKITVDDLSGGTFTISNGGVYGSLMSTPILNPPQSGILGMHKIEERPVVVNKQIVIKPMMYVALSYDHRMIDGKEAVTFLVKVKEGLEDPARLLLEI